MVIALAKLLFLTHPAILPYYFLWTSGFTTIPSQVLAVADEATLSRIDRARNAVWIEHRWFQEGVTDEEIRGLCEHFNETGIRFVYPHLSPSTDDGKLPPFSMEAVARFQKMIRAICPQIKILPWVGGVKFGFRQMRPGTIHLDSESYLQAFANECVYLTQELGLDGVHLNIEPVESGNQRFLEWLEHVRNRIGPEKVLSVAAPKPAFIEGFNFSPLRAWEIDYFEAVGRRSDQLVLMNYDTGIESPFLYSVFVQEKMAGLLQRFSEKRLTCKLVLGVPTYDNAPSHNAEAENIRAAIEGLNSVLSRKDVPKENFEGIALYAYWTTDRNEWQQLHDHWLDAKDATTEAPRH